MVVLDRLLDADRHRLHVAAGHAAVGVQPLVHDHEVLGLLGDLAIAHGEPAADVDEAVLLARHRRAVGQVADLAQDLGDRLVGVALLALLDEVGVLDGAGGVEDDGDALLAAVRRDLAQVRHADRLAAGEVHRHADGDVGDAVGADLLDQRVDLGEVDVALEGMLGGGVVRLVDDDVAEGAAGELLVQARGREVHVAGDVVAVLDQHLRQDVLGAAALMRGDQVLVAVVLLDGGFQGVEVGRAGVRLVAEHHAGPLAIRHGARARVGEQVDVALLGLQEKRVVARRGDRALALGACGHLDGLDDFDLPRLGPAGTPRHGDAPFDSIGVHSGPADASE